MDLAVIDRIVEQALSDLPEEFRNQLDNVGFVVELWPNDFELATIKAHPGTLLFGLYQGVPKTKRSTSYSALPDKITIFVGPILSVSRNMEEFVLKIKQTVFHEIGHHFGMSEEQIRRAEQRNVESKN